MEYGSRWRTALFILLGVVMLFLAIWGVTSIARNIFSPDKETTPSTTQQLNLNDYSTPTSSVTLNAAGPIVANENYISYSIEVTQSMRKITLYKGYPLTTTQVKTYDNNPQAYQNFLSALQLYGYLKAVKSPVGDNPMAQCPSGERYIYYLYNNSQTVSQLWNTSCTSGKAGTMGGNGSAIRTLFKAQIPDYTKIVTGDYAVLQ